MMTTTTPLPRILLAEDEKHLAKGISYNLEKRGYEVEVAPRGDTALELGSTQGFDLIILDVMMPGLDGFEVCRELRNRQILTPILMLTARHETENRIRGIQLGADDYLGKPFNLDELLARVEALLRRRKWDEQAPPTQPTDHELGSVLFNTNLMTLSGSAGQKVSLTVIEARLLQLFIAESGRTIARTEILKKVWGFNEETQTRTLDNFIMRLRAHLATVGGSADWIESVRGVGYRFSPTFTNL
ncbi:MAG: response regulator transcription factor [Deltaproteobacteria bacterium]|nr:response regulator transcription factor [Deltaproteobacteria bacterium]